MQETSRHAAMKRPNGLKVPKAAIDGTQQGAFPPARPSTPSLKGERRCGKADFPFLGLAVKSPAFSSLRKASHETQ
jgi:hypothetical protein